MQGLTLEDKFKATELYKEGLLLTPLKSKMAFTVDNMNGTEDSEMADIHNEIEGIIEEYFPAIPIPASWLMFRVVLNLLNKPVLSLTQCEEIAKRLSMPTSVEEAIWFFLGSLMPYTNIPSMEDTVICNPQVIFDSISKLIIDKFQKASRAITEGEIEQFHQRGLFTLSHIQDTTEHPQSSLLKLNQLVDVLKHHNVLAEVKQDKEIASSSESEPEPKFIMPTVMKYASESELLSPTSTLEATSSPIYIHFAGGFVPFGVFCAGVARLIAQLDSMSPRWQLCNDQVMRNKAKFIIDGAFFAILVSRPQYIMVHVEQHPKARCKTTLEVICSKVRKTVVQALETVILNMKYKPYRTLQVSIQQPFELAFTCNLEDSHCNHFMIVTMDKNGHHAKCLKSKVDFDLDDKHLIWFKDETGTSTDDMKCPVCLNVHVDPCTLSCGHTVCQLCLARMWKSSNKHCPVCKMAWKVLPSISFDYRRNIESAHGHKVERLRKEYSHEDQELIETFLEAKRISSESLAQELEEKPQLHGVWKLPGVEECGETSVVVHSSQGQLVEWNGLKLHIHAGSLPDGLQQCTIFIKASLAGKYEIPDNTSLVSAIYWLRCEPQCTFIKPVTVEIQHCSTQRDLSKLKIVRALCSQKSLPYKFKPLGGSFIADTFYGAIDMKGFSGVGIVDENPNSERMYYSQLFYRSYPSHQQSHEIHITFVWNDDPHINDVKQQYPENRFFPGCHKVVEIEGKEIKVVLDAVKWTEVMEGQWKIQPSQPTVTKAELNDFKPGRGIPSCVLEARPLCEDFPQLLHQVILNGIKPPHHKVILSYMPSRMTREYPSGASVQQPQSPPTVQMPVDIQPIILFSKDMSSDQLALWLRNHPSLSGADYKEDISKLIGAKISAQVFLDLNESILSQITSIGFQLAIMSIIKDMKSSRQPPSSERPPLQPQSPRSSVAIPRTTQHQLNSDTAEQQTIIAGHGSRSQNAQRLSLSASHLPHIPEYLSISSGAAEDISDNSKPTSANMTVIRWKNEGGEIKKFRLKSSIMHKWRDVGNLVVPRQQLEVWAREKDSSKECCEAVLSHWLDHPPRDYPATWEGLYELLEDSELGQVATDLKQAVDNVIR